MSEPCKICKGKGKWLAWNAVVDCWACGRDRPPSKKPKPKPTPAALSTEMIGEDDREALQDLRDAAYGHWLRNGRKRPEIDVLCIQWADRLLNNN